MFWLKLVDVVCMFEADADPLNGIRCPFHFAERHHAIKETKKKQQQQTERFEDVGAFDVPY